MYWLYCIILILLLIKHNSFFIVLKKLSPSSWLLFYHKEPLFDPFIIISDLLQNFSAPNPLMFSQGENIGKGQEFQWPPLSSEWGDALFKDWTIHVNGVLLLLIWMYGFISQPSQRFSLLWPPVALDLYLWFSHPSSDYFILWIVNTLEPQPVWWQRAFKKMIHLPWDHISWI